jgi:hypothetical protein
VIGVIDPLGAQRASYVKFNPAPDEAEPSAPLPRG